MAETVNDYIKKALDLSVKRHQEVLTASSPGLQPMYSSIVKQLEYLYDFVNGKETDRKKMWELNFGVYAAKEFENSDEIFYDRLTSAFYIADQIRSGLKVRLPHEVDKGYYEKQSRLEKLYPEDFN